MLRFIHKFYNSFFLHFFFYHFSSARRTAFWISFNNGKLCVGLKTSLWVYISVLKLFFSVFWLLLLLFESDIADYHSLKNIFFPLTDLEFYFWIFIVQFHFVILKCICFSIYLTSDSLHFLNLWLLSFNFGKSSPIVSAILRLTHTCYFPFTVVRLS